MIQTIVVGMGLGAIYGLVAIGISVVYRSTGVVNFAQGAFVMLGGMVAAWAADEWGWPLFAALAAGVLAAALGGLLMGLGVILPLWRRGAPEFSVILGTLAFLVLAQDLALRYMGSRPRAAPELMDNAVLEVGGVRVSYQTLWVMLTAVALVGLVEWFLQRTRTGTAMRACSVDRTTSRLLGISPVRVGLLALVVTAAIGGLGGALISPVQFTAYSVGGAYGVRGFIAAIIGGLGDVRGAFLGGLIVGLAEALIGVYLTTTYLEVLLLLMLTTMLIVRPAGILSAAR